MTAPPHVAASPRPCILTPAPPPLAADRDAWQHHPMRIAAVRDEVAGVRTYDLVFRDPAAAAGYTFAPGQFNMLYLPGIGEAAISISSDPADRSSISHTVKAVGNVTEALARLGVGDEVILRGPFGTPWPLAELRGHDLVIAVGGVGLASVRAAILQIARDRTSYGRVAVLFGAKTPAGLLCDREYGDWRGRGIDVHIIVDRADAGWSGPTGLVTALFDDLALDPARTGLLACGPEPMMVAVVRRAEAAGLSPPRIFLSLERNMICAARLCGLCQFGPEFVCRDGPVFRFDRIAKFLATPHL
jgi:NAD(P)H-flavin reductase